MTARAGRIPRHIVRLAIAGSALAAAAAVVGVTARGKLPDVLDAPSQPVAGATSQTTTGMAVVGGHPLAVGPRGLILRSIDQGASWQQVTAPVQADFTTVRGSAGGIAWAVGHDAVILKSVDAGANWSRALDGRVLLKSLERAAAGNERLAREVKRTMAQSASPDVWPSALLDIGFIDRDRGFAVGAFGLLLATTDGGATWAPWMDRADNERGYHLYAVRGHAQGLYLAGEQGLLLRLDAAGQRFERVEVPYQGTFFGVEVEGDHVVVYGLRGNVFASADAGASWRKVRTGSDANIVAAVLQGGQLWLATQAGTILTGSAGGDAVATAAALPGAELYAFAPLEAGRFAVARLNGVTTVDVSRPVN